MTIDEMSLLPEVPSSPGLKWREDADPIGYMDSEGAKWEVFRDRNNRLVRSSAATHWMSSAFQAISRNAS